MESHPTSGSAALGRMFWIMIGPAILFLLAIAIAKDGGGWMTFKDMAFLTVLAGLALGRYVEFLGGDPRTSTGQPASREHLRRYVFLSLAVGLTGWTIANLIGNYST